MFASAWRAARLIFDPAFAGIVLRALGLTLLLFIALFAAAEWGLAQLPVLGAHWVNVLLEVLAPVLFLMLLFVLGGPVAAIFASLYLDAIAARIEARDYPNAAPAPGTPLHAALMAGLRLAGVVVAVNFALLPLDIALPGFAELFTLVANGWLLGRQYFELAALRHLPRAGADELRRRHGGKILAAGTLIALLSMIPLVDLFAPLFGAAFMVHLFQRISHPERQP
jgi:CysZ protein